MVMGPIRDYNTSNAPLRPEVDSILNYAGAVLIVYIKFLCFGGSQPRSPIPPIFAHGAIYGLRAIHQLGVLQGTSSPEHQRFFNL